MTTGEAVVAALSAHGLDTIYALPGVHNDEFFDALARHAETIRTVHTRHEQGAAYMALGAALATGKPQAYCVVPGPGLLNSSAALLTAYGMNAPVLALFGQIPEQHIGRDFAFLHEIRDQAGIIARLVNWSARIRSPSAAPRLVAKAIQSMFVERPGPAALECAIDVWGRPGAVRPVAPLPVPVSPIDEDAIKAAAKRLGAAKRPLIVAGGGALDASAEVRQLAELLQAPVLSYRRGRGVIDDRNPLSVNLPLGHELWAEADVVLGVGTHLHMPLLRWGTDRDLAIGLSRTYRWAGFSAWDLPLSVTQHSLTVLALRTASAGGGFTEAEARRELLHDATEALLGGWDPITPLKPHLGDGFHRLVARLQAALDERYQLPAWDDAAYRRHKYADHLAAASEAFHVAGWSRDAMRNDLQIVIAPLVDDPLAPQPGFRPWEPWPPKYATERFLVALQSIWPDRGAPADRLRHCRELAAT